MTDHPSPRLQARGLCALRPPRQDSPSGQAGLLREISLSVPPGHGVALLCADPAEGSLLLDALAGHLRVTAGEIQVDGASVQDLPPGRRRIGLLSDRDPLFPHIDVRANMLFAAEAAGCTRAEAAHRVRDAIALLGLDAVAATTPARLGSTDQVRATLGRLLVGNNAVLLLDNPFSGLPISDRQALQRLCRRLVRARGTSLLITTPDREEALLLGDTIGVLQGGSLHQLDTPAMLLDRPASAAVASLLGQANLLVGVCGAVEDDVANVRLASGQTVEAAADAALEPGTTCVVCVRPERIAVAFPRGGAELVPDAVPATLSELVQMGDHVRLRFRLEDGTEVAVRRPAAQSTAGLHPDRPALLAWQPQHAVALPMDEAAEALAGPARERLFQRGGY